MGHTRISKAEELILFYLQMIFFYSLFYNCGIEEEYRCIT